MSALEPRPCPGCAGLGRRRGELGTDDPSAPACEYCDGGGLVLVFPAKSGPSLTARCAEHVGGLEETCLGWLVPRACDVCGKPARSLCKDASAHDLVAAYGDPRELRAALERLRREAKYVLDNTGDSIATRRLEAPGNPPLVGRAPAAVDHVQQPDVTPSGQGRPRDETGSGHVPLANADEEEVRLLREIARQVKRFHDDTAHEGHSNVQCDAICEAWKAWRDRGRAAATSPAQPCEDAGDGTCVVEHQQAETVCALERERYAESVLLGLLFAGCEVEYQPSAVQGRWYKATVDEAPRMLGSTPVVRLRDLDPAYSRDHHPGQNRTTVAAAALACVRLRRSEATPEAESLRSAREQLSKAREQVTRLLNTLAPFADHGHPADWRDRPTEEEVHVIVGVPMDHVLFVSDLLRAHAVYHAILKEVRDA